MQLLSWLFARLSERSTWLGIVGVATAAGITLSPELIESIIALGIAAAGLIAVVTKDKLPPKA